MNQTKIQLPPDCTLKSDPSRERMTGKQVSTILRCILHGEPKRLTVSKTSGIKGEPLNEFVEVDADGYKLGCFVRGDVVSNVFLVTSPSGKEWEINSGDGRPFVDLPIEDQRRVTELFIGESLAKLCRVVPLWKVHRGSGKPSFPPAFMTYNTEAEALKALEKIQLLRNERVQLSKKELREG